MTARAGPEGLDGLALDEGQGAVEAVAELGFEVDAEGLVDGGGEVGGGERARSAGYAPLRSDEPIIWPPWTPAPAKAAEKTAGQWSRPLASAAALLKPLPMRGVRPNSPATTTRVSSRRPEAARSSRSAETPLSSGRQQVVLQAVEVVVVGVPGLDAAHVGLDDGDAGLDQPAGQQERLAVRVAAVAVAGFGRIPVDLEGGGDLAGEQERVGDFLLASEGVVFGLAHPGVALTVDGVVELFALLEAFDGAAEGQARRYRP